MRQITSLLIANRGEIACRVIRTARDIGIRTIAVYSEADANSPHVKLADDAYFIGPASASESYLSIETLIATAKTASADAIHPGYGFLSENADFAEAVAKAGIIFVGPPPEAIRVMGDKARAKRKMLAAGVPCVPGYEDEDQTNDVLIEAASDIGFPLMVKAAAGGGGRGMRLVTGAADLLSALKLARAEAKNAFGSDELILEKAITDARHVEIQVFGDTHGKIIHLGERDCSVQRRHQKIIEEAPCPVMTADLRAAMGAAAIEAAKAVDYVGAGTVEFLLGSDNAFYFLEMNTRLQVEHPVTELVTGIDLVKLQIEIAEGKSLPIAEDAINFEGHAIEARLYAEDPMNDFLPSTGSVHLFRPPDSAHIRVDAGIETGGEVSPFYDPMVAKVIAHGQTRDEARRLLTNALSETALLGIKSNREFLQNVLKHETFANGDATTTFIADHFPHNDTSAQLLSGSDFAIAATIVHILAQDTAIRLAPPVNEELLNWSSSGSLRRKYQLSESDQVQQVEVISEAVGAHTCIVASEHFDVEISAASDSLASLRLNGVGYEIAYVRSSEETYHISGPDRSFTVRNITGGVSTSDTQSGSGTLKAPMHGKLVSLDVKAGDKVSVGDKLAVLEAMKMQHELIAEINGVVTEILSNIDANLAADDIILIVEDQ